jgi:mycothiol synthase
MIELARVESEVDADAYLAVRRAIDPVHQISRRAYLQHMLAPGRVDLLARAGGEAVAGAFVEPFQGNLAGSTAFVSVRVRREWRRQGIGTTLFAAVSELARASRWTELYTVARHDDADTIAYVGKRGFRETMRMQQLALDLDAAGEPGPRHVPDGVELLPLTPELERKTYEAAREIHPDFPDEPGFVGEIEQWRREELPQHVLRDCTFVAVAAGEAVGYATLLDADDGVGLHGVTGVRRAWRGRGVAHALKQAQVAAARARGLRELRTTTSSANGPMLRVNERLGYRRDVAWIHFRGPLLLS